MAVALAAVVRAAVETAVAMVGAKEAEVMGEAGTVEGLAAGLVAARLAV